MEKSPTLQRLEKLFLILGLTRLQQQNLDIIGKQHVTIINGQRHLSRLKKKCYPWRMRHWLPHDIIWKKIESASTILLRKKSLKNYLGLV